MVVTENRTEGCRAYILRQAPGGGHNGVMGGSGFWNGW